MKKQIADYFLNSKNPYAGAPRVNLKRAGAAATALGLVAIFVVLFIDTSPKAQGEATVTPDTLTQPAIVEQPVITAPRIEAPARANQPSTRQYSASQLVTPTQGSGTKLPMGSTFTASVLNTVVSTDNSSPVIAYVPAAVYFNSTPVIEKGARLIGTASLDQRSKRLQVRFNSLVLPDGQQLPISGLALQQDGSSGLVGNFDSGNSQQQLGRFGGNFVAGLAEGLKDRQAGSGWSGPFEPGSIKNGLLNGFADSASDQAHRFSTEMQGAQPSMTVDAGTSFLVYLEQEFNR